MQFYQVDSFTDKSFKGNPAAVCIVTGNISAELMQNIAMEMNLSETAFIRVIEEKIFSIRFFTPKEEVDLCGHATLAAAKVVHDLYGYREIAFNANLDILDVTVRDGIIEMQFPKSEPMICLENKDLLEAIGIEKPVQTLYAEKIFMHIIECSSEKELLKLKPDFYRLLHCKLENNIKGLAVTCKSSNEIFDFTSRCFWPWIGIDEDPVTGAAHSALGPFWAKKLGKTKLKAYQSSRRGGCLDLSVMDNHVIIKGQACLIMKGRLFL